MELYYKMPHNKGGPCVRSDILASTAWNALIHHPVEDSDAEELPSTVDIDAIKGAPITGHTGHWNSLNSNITKSNVEEKNESDSDDDKKISDSNSRSSSDSQSEVCNCFKLIFKVGDEKIKKLKWEN